MKIAPPNPVQLATQSKWKVSPPDSNPNHIGRSQKGGNNTDLERRGLPLVLPQVSGSPLDNFSRSRLAIKKKRNKRYEGLSDERLILMERQRELH